MEEKFMWELITKDDERYEIPPAAVSVVQKRMASHDPINLSTASIPYSEIKHFRQTGKAYGQQPLLEAAAQAFNEPVLGADGSMAARWVKKRVTQREYAKHYGAIPAYRRLEGDGSMVMVAFRLSIHDIDVNKVTYCTPAEEESLTRQ